ncbi:MAG TPA: sugar transferase [Terriglobales bacterium]|nr:sugar transferase [Terriglobales bacterium]
MAIRLPDTICRSAGPPVVTSVSSARPLFWSFAKRALDICVSALVIVLGMPAFVVIGALVWLDSGCPVIYRRRVVGPKGEFDAFKFRSMKPDADSLLAADLALREEFEQNFKLRNDPRLTRVGAVIRKFSVDELPQLFNVLMGQMSLVGPRMITAGELAKYGPHQKQLLSVKPGLTGYWQINGRQAVSYDDRVRMDMFYIQHWSFWLDLKIIMKTPVKVLRREGAY